MRITQIMLSGGFGGAERYFVDLGNALAQRGHRVQIICHKEFIGKNKFILSAVPDIVEFLYMAGGICIMVRKSGRRSANSIRILYMPILHVVPI